MPKLPDWLLAHMMFANLTDELKNDMNEVYVSYFQNGQRSFQSWCYSNVFSMATKCESNPKFQAEKRQQKQITRSISAVDFTNSGTSQNAKDDNDQGTDDHNGTISRNAYYDVHRKKYDSMFQSELKAYHAKIKQIREKPTQIPDADGQIQYTMKKKTSCVLRHHRPPWLPILQLTWPRRVQLHTKQAARQASTISAQW